MKSPVAAAAKSLQSCPTLCDPLDSSPPGSPVPGILQARTLEWVTIAFSSAWKWKWGRSIGVRLLATPWAAAHQAPRSLGLSRQEDWSGAPSPSPEKSSAHGLNFPELLFPFLQVETFFKMLYQYLMIAIIFGKSSFNYIR